MVAGMFGMFFLGALYLQRVLRYDALEIGLAFLPATLVMGTALAALLRTADHALRRRARCCSPASSLIAAGLLLFARAPVHGSYLTDVLPAMLLLGFGIGARSPR